MQFHSRLAEEAGFELLCALEPRPGPQRWAALFAHTSPECILLDANEHAPALETLRHFQSLSPLCPIIAFTEAPSAPQALELLSAGAFEYIDPQTTA
ncbi:MAG: response regulator, partial [Desulfobacterales bacterium]|nr:response regulator [Desulfobacterales bacterium]